MDAAAAGLPSGRTRHQHGAERSGLAAVSGSVYIGDVVGRQFERTGLGFERSARRIVSAVQDSPRLREVEQEDGRWELEGVHQKMRFEPKAESRLFQSPLIWGCEVAKTKLGAGLREL